MKYRDNTPIPETLADVEQLKHLAVLTPEQIAPVLGTTPDMIRAQADANPASFGFPVTIIGTRKKFPRLAFIYYMKYGYACPSELMV